MSRGGEVPMSAPPDQGHKAAFDPVGFQRSAFTAGVETGGLWKSVVQFLIAFVIGFAVAKSLGFSAPQLFGFLAGVITPIVTHLVRRRRLKTQTDMLIGMQGAIHELELEAKRLEIEEAKQNGNLDRWKK